MRILQVVPFYYPAEAFGGPVPVVGHVSEELVRRGHEVIVYTTDAIGSSTRQKARYLEIRGVKVHYFRNWSNSLAWHRLFFAPGIVPQLRKEIRTFDVIHLQDYRTFQNIVVHHYAKKYGIPYVLQAHGSVGAFFQKGFLKRTFDTIWGYRILRDASKAIAVTKIEAEQLKNVGASEDKIKIVPPGIDLSEFGNLPKKGGFRNRYGLNSSQRIILYLARIHKIKGPDLLAKAFSRLLGDVSDTQLVFVGPDDGYLPALKKLVKELRIEERVLFTGPLFGKEKLEAYVDADVYVLPSSYEIFGLTVLEACACGTPVVVTEACGLADWINQRAGFKVAHDEHRLQEAIGMLLTNEELRKQLGDQASELVREQFSWHKAAQQIEKIYTELLSSSSAVG